MGVTQVIRGEDHIPNTPRQILIYEALGVEPPRFAHMPLMLGKDRAKLSKRHGALSVLAYREQGFLPQSLCNYLARLGWSHGDQEIFSREELIQIFHPGACDQISRGLRRRKAPVAQQPLSQGPAGRGVGPGADPVSGPGGINDPDQAYLARVVPTLSARCQHPGGDGRGGPLLFPGPPAL